MNARQRRKLKRGHEWRKAVKNANRKLKLLGINMEEMLAQYREQHHPYYFVGKEGNPPLVSEAF